MDTMRPIILAVATVGRRHGWFAFKPNSRGENMQEKESVRAAILNFWLPGLGYLYVGMDTPEGELYVGRSNQ